ncbi:MAG: type 4a pilus biogenesis protein PilO [bacterium]|nr:type 4a pilus biogenesis protein PilO [bacterium]
MNRTLYIGLLLFSGIAAGIFVTWPKFQEFSALALQLKERQREVENRETYFANLTSVRSTLEELKEPLAKVEAALPSDPQLPALYDFLQGTSALSGLSVRNISSSVDDKAQALEMRTIPVTLELTGSWGAIKELVSRLQTASRIVSLQSLNVSGTENPGTFQVVAQLNAYSY